jgi:capsule assembly protein Wzi
VIRRREVGCVVVAIGTIACRLPAQVPAGWSTRELVAVNTEIERYLRVLQDKGVVPAHSWDVRAFGPRELDTLIPATTNHPWTARVGRPSRSASAWYFLAPEATLIYNSAFPYGFNDGAIWAGRGVTGAIQAGVGGRVGPFSFSVEPIAFGTQNSSFALLANGLTGKYVFDDGTNPQTIDLPQRFGNGVYQRIDPGQTTIRLDFPVVAFGLSTANDHWGPAIDNPLILGNNAAGIPHVFLGTSAPVDIFIGRIHGRVEYGRLSQSQFAFPSDSETRRFMSGIVASFSPRGVPGLDIGGARFFHTVWPDSGLTSHDFLRPFEGLSYLATQGPGHTAVGLEGDNQLASIFFRWVFPPSGVELYGEYGRDDHNLDTRDLLVEPDHESAFTLGLQKVWTLEDGSLLTIRGEHTDARITSIALGRLQAPFYVHTVVTQGHTQYGQLLGGMSVYGGGGSTLELSKYDGRGRWTMSWVRLGREQLLTKDHLPVADQTDVIHALSLERLFFQPHFDVTWSITAARDLNRNFSSDATNIRLATGVRYRP